VDYDPLSHFATAVVLKKLEHILKLLILKLTFLCTAFTSIKHMFELKQRDRYVSAFDGELKSLIDEMEMHQPAVTDAAKLRGHRHDLIVSKFLSGLVSHYDHKCEIRYWEEIVYTH